MSQVLLQTTKIVLNSFCPQRRFRSFSLIFLDLMRGYIVSFERGLRRELRKVCSVSTPPTAISSPVTSRQMKVVVRLAVLFFGIGRPATSPEPCQK